MIQDVVQPLIDRTEFSLEEIIGSSRKSRLVIVRHLLFWHLRSFKDEKGSHVYGLKEIGNFFNRNHATVVHGVDNIKNFIEIKDTLVFIYVNKLGLKVH